MDSITRYSSVDRCLEVPSHLIVISPCIYICLPLDVTDRSHMEIVSVSLFIVQSLQVNTLSPVVVYRPTSYLSSLIGVTRVSTISTITSRCTLVSGGDRYPLHNIYNVLLFFIWV